MEWFPIQEVNRSTGVRLALVSGVQMIFEPGDTEQFVHFMDFLEKYMKLYPHWNVKDYTLTYFTEIPSEEENEKQVSLETLIRLASDTKELDRLVIIDFENCHRHILEEYERILHLTNVSESSPMLDFMEELNQKFFTNILLH